MSKNKKMTAPPPPPDAMAIADDLYGGMLGEIDDAALDKAFGRFTRTVDANRWRYDMLNLAFLQLVELRAIRTSLGRRGAELRALPEALGQIASGALAELEELRGDPEDEDPEPDDEQHDDNVVDLPVTNPDGGVGEDDGGDLPLDDDDGGRGIEDDHTDEDITHGWTED